MLRLALGVSLASIVAFAACGDAKSSAPRVAKIVALGVQAELPEGWGYIRVSKQHRLAKSDAFFAYLTPVKKRPTAPTEPITDIDIDVRGKIENLPQVRVFIPVGDKAVLCHGVVMPPADPNELLAICNAVRPLAE